MIDSKIFNFQFFLGGRTKVNDLIGAARMHGGATKLDDGIYSNINTDNLIKVNPVENNLSIFIPSTVNVNEVIDNGFYVEKTLAILKNSYDITKMKFYNTEGSWYDEETDSVVIEKITIITVEMNTISTEDINFFIRIANSLKYAMRQQAVSIQINDSLAIV